MGKLANFSATQKRKAAPVEVPVEKLSEPQKAVKKPQPKKRVKKPRKA